MRKLGNYTDEGSLAHSTMMNTAKNRNIQMYTEYFTHKSS